MTPILPDIGGNTHAEDIEANFEVVREGTIQALDDNIRVQVTNGIDNENESDADEPNVHDSVV